MINTIVKLCAALLEMQYKYIIFLGSQRKTRSDRKSWCEGEPG